MWNKIKNYIYEKSVEFKQNRESRKKIKKIVEILQSDQKEVFDDLEEEIRQRLHSEEGYYYGKKY